jgi:hypothetical protein
LLPVDAFLSAQQGHLRQKQGPKKNPHAVAHNAPVHSAFGADILERATETVASAEKGERHDTLFKQAARIGGYIAGGEINAAAAFAALMVAAEKSLLVSDDGEAKVRATINDGFTKGRETPRCAEQRDVNKPIIYLRPGELAKTVHAAEAALIRSRFGIYQRGGQLCSVHKESSPEGADNLQIVDVGVDKLMLQLSQIARWCKFKTVVSEPITVPTDPPLQVVRSLLRKGQWGCRC